MKTESLTDHLPDFFNAYFECFQFVDVIMQQKPDQQAKIFAYLCHAPVPPQVIIELAHEAQHSQPITEHSSSKEEIESSTLPDEKNEATLLEAVTFLQNLTPSKKHKLFISESKNVEKITWARFAENEDLPETDKGELEKALREKKLHLVHGHTSGDAKGATNLDTSWGKSKNNKRQYLASVHHTGASQATEIKQTYFKYIADLEKHPSWEKDITEIEQVDPKLLGIVPMQENDTLELGDMHANALRLIYHLIKHGVFKVSVAEYSKMVDLYNEIYSLFQDGYELDCELDKDQVKQKHLAFKTLIDKITIKEQSIKLKLIGDLLADRGASDILMEWLIIKLHKAENITLSILASNHDRAYFIKPGESRNSALPSGFFYNRQRRSLDNAVEIRDKDPANEIKDYKLPESNNSINHSLTPVQLTTSTPVQLTTSLEKILRSPLTWAILTAAAAAYPAYDCIQADKVDSLSTVFDHLIHHGTLTLVLSAAAATCLLMTAGATLYSLCAKNNSDSTGFLNQG